MKQIKKSKPKHRRFKRFSTAQLPHVPKSPNREIIQGYADRAKYVDMDRLFKMGYDPYKQTPNEPRKDAEAALQRIRDFLTQEEFSINMNVVVLDMPGVKRIWKFFNSTRTKVCFLRHDIVNGLFEHSVVYRSDSIARQKFAQGKVLYAQIIHSKKSSLS